MSNIDFSKIPTVGWIVFSLFGLLIFILIAGVICGLIYVLLKKNIKLKNFETADVKPEIKEKYIAEGKDLVDNQSQVAKLMLKGLRTRLYTTAISLFNITDVKDRTILELITYRICDRLNYELKNDFTRNHITNKSDFELEQYSTAKAKGYYELIKERMYVLNHQLPDYDLVELINTIPPDDIKNLFKDIYFSARGIAGYNPKNGG